MTPAGLAQLERDEDCVLTAYPDPESPLAKACAARGLRGTAYHQVPGWAALSGAPWTIGYGCTGPGIVAGTVWAQAQASAELLKRVQQVEAQLDHALPWWRTFGPVRCDAIVNQAYNLGVQGFLAFHGEIADLHGHAWAQAAADALDSRWAHQVGDRAKRIAIALRTGVAS